MHTPVRFCYKGMGRQQPQGCQSSSLCAPAVRPAYICCESALPCLDPHHPSGEKARGRKTQVDIFGAGKGSGSYPNAWRACFKQFDGAGKLCPCVLIKSILFRAFHSSNFLRKCFGDENFIQEHSYVKNMFVPHGFSFIDLFSCESVSRLPWSSFLPNFLQLHDSRAFYSAN